MEIFIHQRFMSYVQFEVLKQVSVSAIYITLKVTRMEKQVQKADRLSDGYEAKATERRQLLGNLLRMRTQWDITQSLLRLSDDDLTNLTSYVQQNQPQVADRQKWQVVQQNLQEITDSRKADAKVINSEVKRLDQTGTKWELPSVAVLIIVNYIAQIIYFITSNISDHSKAGIERAMQIVSFIASLIGCIFNTFLSVPLLWSKMIRFMSSRDLRHMYLKYREEQGSKRNFLKRLLEGSESNVTSILYTLSNGTFGLLEKLVHRLSHPNKDFLKSSITKAKSIKNNQNSNANRCYTFHEGELEKIIKRLINLIIIIAIGTGGVLGYVKGTIEMFNLENSSELTLGLISISQVALISFFSTVLAYILLQLCYKAWAFIWNMYHIRHYNILIYKQYERIELLGQYLPLEPSDPIHHQQDLTAQEKAQVIRYGMSDKTEENSEGNQILQRTSNRKKLKDAITGYLIFQTLIKRNNSQQRNDQFWIRTAQYLQNLSLNISTKIMLYLEYLAQIQPQQKFIFSLIFEIAQSKIVPKKTIIDWIVGQVQGEDKKELFFDTIRHNKFQSIAAKIVNRLEK